MPVIDCSKDEIVPRQQLVAGELDLEVGLLVVAFDEGRRAGEFVVELARDTR